LKDPLPPVQRRGAEAAEFFGGFIPQDRFVTFIILTINVALFLACLLMNPDGTELGDVNIRVLALFGAKRGDWIQGNGQWFRLVTAGFLHGGLLHILMNSWALYDVGAFIERTFGVWRYIAIYFASTVGGFLLSSAFSYYTVSIGASAGIFGLIGALIAVGLLDRSAMGAEIKSQAIRWAMYGLMMSFLPFFQMDNGAHIGGLVTGLAVTWLAGFPSLFMNWRERLWQVIGSICLILTGVSFLRWYWWFSGMQQ
jgi:rhomboid protease GluP